MQHSNSILIVEDAEHIILDRKQETFLPKQAVSNLLNLSDGLLGDAMHQQIICTFNCDVQAIDPALLRDGRLPKFVTKNEYEAIALRRGQEEAAENDREHERRESDHYRREKRESNRSTKYCNIPLLAWIRSLPTVDKSLDADHDSYAFILALTRELAQ
ncbi:unnamed protein product [Rotaria sp. Silwood1]|nr:unnamed protein product [Rotaria sp. Silwood1]